MAITTRAQRQQRRNEALQLISSGVPPTDAATQLTVKWGCSRRTSLRDIEIAQSELANALNSVELQQMVGWSASQYQRLAAKAERDGQDAKKKGTKRIRDCGAEGFKKAIAGLEVMGLGECLQAGSVPAFRALKPWP